MVGIKASGKGTQASRLAKKLGILHISSGDIFRDIDVKSPLGKKIRSFIDKGMYVPDDLVLEIVAKRLKKKDCKEGFVLDGFPRTLNQAKEFDKKHKLDHVVSIKVSRKEALHRISGRRVCKKCDISYNIYTAPKPKKAGICDKCGSKLFQRKDETKEAATRRINKDMKELGPMLKFHRAQGIVVEVNGEQPIEAVQKEIREKLGIK